MIPHSDGKPDRTRLYIALYLAIATVTLVILAAVFFGNRTLQFPDGFMLFQFVDTLIGLGIVLLLTLPIGFVLRRTRIKWIIVIGVLLPIITSAFYVIFLHPEFHGAHWALRLAISILTFGLITPIPEGASINLFMPILFIIGILSWRAFFQGLLGIPNPDIKLSSSPPNKS